MASQVYITENCYFDKDRLELYLDGKIRPLRSKALTLLCYLIQNKNIKVSPESIYNNVWHDIAYEYDNLLPGELNQIADLIKEIRKAINDTGKGKTGPLKTIKGYGYRLDCIEQKQNIQSHTDTHLSPETILNNCRKRFPDYLKQRNVSYEGDPITNDSLFHNDWFVGFETIE